MHADWNAVLTLALGVSLGIILADVIRFVASLVAGKH